MRVPPKHRPLALMESADPILISNPSCSAQRDCQVYGSSGLILLAITIGNALRNLFRAPSGEISKGLKSFSRAAAD